MKKIDSLAVAAVILLVGSAVSAADKGGVVLSFKAGSSKTLAPDGKSQTVLVVNINPKAAEWGKPADVKNGRFSLRVTWYGKGKLSPKRADKVRFPVYITITSWKLPKGVHTQESAAVVSVTYTPPGDVAGRQARTCTAKEMIKVTSKPIESSKPPKPKPNKNAQLVAAVRSGDSAAVKKLLAAGANPNVRHARYWWRPLHFAVVCSPRSPKAKPSGTVPASTIRTRLELIELLLAAGANINAKDKQLATPLHLAAIKGQTTEVVRLLLDHGADPGARMRAFRNRKSAAIVTPAEAAGQAPPPWNKRIQQILSDALKDKGWKPAHEYANCHSYTIFLLTGENHKKPVNDLQPPVLERVLRSQGYIPLPNRSHGMKLDDETILSRLRHGDVLVIGNRHSATVHKMTDGIRFHHFAGQTAYDAAGGIISRSDLGKIILDKKTGKRTYIKPGTGGQVAGASPGPKHYEIHCSPRGNIATMSRGIKPWGKDPVVIWRRLGRYKHGSWYLVADRTSFTSTSDTGHTESNVRTFTARFDVVGKFEDKPGKTGITFTGVRKTTDAKTGVTHDAEMTAVFDDRMEKLLSVKIKHNTKVPDRGGIKGSRTELDMKAADIDVRRVYRKSIFCRTGAPQKRISHIKHTVRRGRWTTTLGKVGAKKVAWLYVTFSEDKPPPRP